MTELKNSRAALASAKAKKNNTAGAQARYDKALLNITTSIATYHQQQTAAAITQATTTIIQQTVTSEASVTNHVTQQFAAQP